MRPRLTYANVVATIALFIALGGASYAAIKLPKNSIGAKQIKKNAVTAPKVKDGTLSAADVDTRSIQARITGNCRVGDAVIAVNQDGSVSCTGTGGPPTGPAGGDLHGTYPNPTLAAPPAWRDVTFATGWSNFAAGGAANVQCYLDAGGVVHLRGWARQESGAGALMWTLPPECRPSYDFEPGFPEVNSGGSGTVVGVGHIDTSGNAFLESALPGLNAGVGADGITFRPTN
jgi:hypothetical protein